jgi:hypothetical protein
MYRIEALNSRVSELTARLEDLERQHQEDRITFPKLVDARCEQLLQEIKELKIKFDANTVQREEKEKRILLKVQDQGKWHILCMTFYISYVKYIAFL